jgi:hypothetical protein
MERKRNGGRTELGTAKNEAGNWEMEGGEGIIIKGWGKPNPK